MEVVKVDGIVIKEIDFKESSKILTVITREYGVISVLSKGCKKIKSKLRSASLKLTYASFYVNLKLDGISNLCDATVINNFKNIMFDISKITYASYILELTSNVIKESNNYNEIFDNLINGFIKIDNGLDEVIITSILEIKYLDYLGVSPNLDNCNRCGSSSNITTLSIIDGGYICKNCYNGGKIYNEKVLKLLKLFKVVDISKLTKIDIKEENLNDIKEIIDMYYDEYTGIYLKSKIFLKKVMR